MICASRLNIDTFPKFLVCYTAHISGLDVHLLDTNLHIGADRIADRLQW
jgi:hypothetical protein